VILQLIFIFLFYFLQSISPGSVISEGIEENADSVLSMKPERVASMVIVALTTPADIVVNTIIILNKYSIYVIDQTESK
jgi:hypothetical protein